MPIEREDFAVFAASSIALVKRELPITNDLRDKNGDLVMRFCQDVERNNKLVACH